MIKGTDSDFIESVLKKIPEAKRKYVKDVSVDLAPTMQKAGMRSFPDANLISDRFHVQQVVTEAVQEVRIQHRRKAIDQENKAVGKARKNGVKYKPEIMPNGDTRKQLLARSRYALFKAKSKWSPSQKQRIEILFREYPELKKAYELSMNMRSIFEQAKDQEEARKRF